MGSKTRARHRVKNKFSLPMGLLFVWTLLFVALPMAYIVMISFRERGENGGISQIWTLKNYKQLLDPLYYSIYGRSLIVAAGTTLATLLTGYPFAYALAKLPEAWRSKVTFFLMAPFWTNSLVRLTGWTIFLRADGPINRLLLSMGLIDKPLKLLFTNGATLVGMVYALLPIMILGIYNSTEKLDWTQVEAARDLGASRFTAFRTVTLAQTRPGILAGCVLTFVPSMGLFFISDLLGGAKTSLIGNLIQAQVQTAHNWPFAAALSVLMLAFASLMIFLYGKASGEHDFGALV